MRNWESGACNCYFLSVCGILFPELVSLTVVQKSAMRSIRATKDEMFQCSVEFFDDVDIGILHAKQTSLSDKGSTTASRRLC